MSDASQHAAIIAEDGGEIQARISLQTWSKVKLW